MTAIVIIIGKVKGGQGAVGVGGEVECDLVGRGTDAACVVIGSTCDEQDNIDKCIHQYNKD